MLPEILRFLHTWKISLPLVFLSVYFINPSETLAGDEAVMTTIILINSEAMLVDLDERGEILKQHILVADYFTSSQSHEALVRRSIDRIRDLSDIGMIDQTVPSSSLQNDNSADIWESKRLKSSFTICDAYYLAAASQLSAEILAINATSDNYWKANELQFNKHLSYGLHAWNSTPTRPLSKIRVRSKSAFVKDYNARFKRYKGFT